MLKNKYNVSLTLYIRPFVLVSAWQSAFRELTLLIVLHKETKRLRNMSQDNKEKNGRFITSQVCLIKP